MRLHTRCFILAVSLASVLPSFPATVDADFSSATTVPVTAAGYTATGNDVSLSLGFAPPTGTNLTVINNPGLALIDGQFTNLAQGQEVSLLYDGIAYKFVADYFGGTGNDLVLFWAYQNLTSWGDNRFGQLGNATFAEVNTPGLVTESGTLAGKAIVSIAAGDFHCLARCSDGRLAAWGNNFDGQLGDGTTKNYRNTPVLVMQSGVLADKTIISIAAGANHSLALCSDGTLASWGSNAYGQLGDGTITSNSTPVLVTQSGVLAGKTITFIAAGANHSLALCSDGALAVWGGNASGQLGDGTTTNRSTPVLLTQSEVLAGKMIVSIAAGAYHTLALCSDGALAAWGSNASGRLGDGTTTSRSTPVLVTQSGVLAGKTIVSIAAGGSHSLAVASDGTLATWGYNNFGQLGVGTTFTRYTPTQATQHLVLAGKTIVSIAAGSSHSLALAALKNPNTLTNIRLSAGNFSPSFSSGITSYSLNVSNTTTYTTLKPTGINADAAIQVNGVPVFSGTVSAAIPLAVGVNTLSVLVTGQDGITTTAYTIKVTRAASYDFWKDTVFTTTEQGDPAICDLLATPAGDGITNLMKFAFGLDPMRNGTAGLPALSNDSGYLTFTYRKAKQATDLIYTVQAGNALTEEGWSTATNMISQTDEDNHWLVTVRDTDAMASHSFAMGSIPRSLLRLLGLRW